MSEALTREMLMAVIRERLGNNPVMAGEREVSIRAAAVAEAVGAPLGEILNELRSMRDDGLISLIQDDPICAADVVPWIRLQQD